MKQLLIAVLLFTSCSKKIEVVNYSVTSFKQDNKWVFNLNFDREINISGVVELDILFETTTGKKVVLKHNLYLGMVLNHPSSHYSNIDAVEKVKVLSIKAKIIDNSGSNQTFMQIKKP
jgi:hypothetical protein